MNKYTKHTYVVGLKKAYSQLQNAMKMIPITEGCSAGDYDCAGMFQVGASIGVTNIDGIDFSGNASNKLTYLLSKQFKIKKLCFDKNEPGCTFIKGLYGGDSTSFYAAGFCTADGTQYAAGISDYYEYSMVASIGVDINGDKGPNKFGRDRFEFYIAMTDKNGIAQGTVIPAGSKVAATYFANEYDYYWNSSKQICTTQNYSYSRYCTGRVLEEDAMNY